jgi:hypothetical protein
MFVGAYTTAEDKLLLQKAVNGWVSNYLKDLYALESTINCISRLHLQSLAPTNLHSALARSEIILELSSNEYLSMLNMTLLNS